ncbi:MAG: PEP-CTERM sorting domain-containing protein, partial [Armatimonadota bacterium]|nr:PEP-CTERM sorting domain-containing protein [Armatimonadota bacterium]
GGMVGLGDLPGGWFYSEAYGVSADGSVVVGVGVTDNREAFRWTEATGMVGLGDLPGGAFYSEAYGVSADGSVVVGYSDSASGDEAFLWRPDTGMQRLYDVLVAQGDGAALTGWSLQYAYAVSADGRTIVGYGRNPSGNTEAWLARLNQETQTPEPASLALLGVGVAGWLARRRQRR